MRCCHHHRCTEVGASPRFCLLLWKWLSAIWFLGGLFGNVIENINIIQYRRCSSAPNIPMERKHLYTHTFSLSHGPDDEDDAEFDTDTLQFQLIILYAFRMRAHIDICSFVLTPYTHTHQCSQTEVDHFICEQVRFDRFIRLALKYQIHHVGIFPLEQIYMPQSHPCKSDTRLYIVP